MGATNFRERQAALRSSALETSSALRDLPRIGDTWTYNIFDRGRKTDTLTVSITGVSQEGRVTEKLARAKFPAFSASRTFEPEFNPRAYQEIDTPGQMFLPEFSPYVAPDASMIGKKWEDLTPSLTAALGHQSIRREVWSMKLEISGSERIRVPAGEFMTIKVEGVTNIDNGWGNASLKLTYWYAPQAKRTIRFVREVRTSYEIARQEDIYELANFKLKE